MRPILLLTFAILLAPSAFGQDASKWVVVESTDQFTDRVTKAAVLDDETGHFRLHVFADREGKPAVLVTGPSRFSFDTSSYVDYRFDAGEVESAWWMSGKILGPYSRQSPEFLRRMTSASRLRVRTPAGDTADFDLRGLADVLPRVGLRAE